ncbi:hypothetical protein AB0892_02250 [Streptomyces sp. NPDC005409]|uniref:hypothetical protein n=1 Tax=Streptomyces sp. NPDC005409 TaxID=3155342 RepID=UPI0034558A87
MMATGLDGSRREVAVLKRRVGEVVMPESRIAVFTIPEDVFRIVSAEPESGGQYYCLSVRAPKRGMSRHASSKGCPVNVSEPAVAPVSGCADLDIPHSGTSWRMGRAAVFEVGYRIVPALYKEWMDRHSASGKARALLTGVSSFKERFTRVEGNHHG